MSPSSADALSRLCLACGACCDGTLFSVVELAPSEDAARSALLPWARAGGALVAAMPCRGLVEQRCTLYADRPDTCRRYECLLFKAQREGEVGEPGALEVVARMRALADEVQRLEGGGPGALVRLRRERPVAGTPLATAFADAEAYFRFHFLGQQRGR